MSVKGQRVEVKKVKPYPIQALVIDGSGDDKGYQSIIIKVNTLGLFLQSPKIYIPGAKLRVEFEIPVLKHTVSKEVVVRRMLDKFDPYAGPEGPKVVRFAECHFSDLSADDKQQILRFTQKINQKD